MKIAIIGAGFTGLAAAKILTDNGHEVTIFEKDNLPGGLALGFKEKNWEWSIEKYYHHLFSNDKSILDLAKKINFEVILKRPKTSVFVDEKIYQLDSPIHVLKFKKLKVIDRIRMAFVLAVLKYNPVWQPLEKFRASIFLPKFMGKNAYELLWEPQLSNKFGSYINEISLAWFWARIKKRTPSLGYPKGGFIEFTKALTKSIQNNKGNFLFNTEVKNIKKINDQIQITYLKEGEKNNITENFDKVIVTLPSFIFLKITPELPKNYQEKLLNLKGIGAITLLLRLRKEFFSDNTYWLSVCKKNSPVMAIVEHTNYMDRKYYNGEHLVYAGNYLSFDDPQMKMSKDEILERYNPILEKINKDYKKNIIGYEVFRAPFAQPIVPINYSKIIPPFKTPIDNLYLANIQQVYPWDRGTNYAVELGEKIANLILSHKI